MDVIIANSQSAFICSWIITDNIVVEHELLYSMKHNMKGKVRKMAVQLGISKAYDRVE